LLVPTNLWREKGWKDGGFTRISRGEGADVGTFAAFFVGLLRRERRLHARFTLDLPVRRTRWRQIDGENHMSPSPSTTTTCNTTPAPTSLLFRPRGGQGMTEGMTDVQHLPTANDIFIEYLRCLRGQGSGQGAGNAGR
jgi:hypothetical protein